MPRDAALPPDLVIFDVDGTLHDAFRWWAPLLRRGLARFREHTGVAVTIPDDAAADAVIGMKDIGVWGPFLPEAERHRWPELRAMVLPMEVDELGSGRDHLFPGVRPLLAHLRAIGVGTAIASNCRSTYMRAMCEGQGLGAATDWQFCLDSAGVETKTDMLRLAAAAAGAEHPVMVGDREPDLEAAQAVGMPFYWRVNSRCDLTDAAAGCWEGDPDDLLRQLGLPRISRAGHDR